MMVSSWVETENRHTFYICLYISLPTFPSIPPPLPPGMSEYNVPAAGQQAVSLCGHLLWNPRVSMRACVRYQWKHLILSPSYGGGRVHKDSCSDSEARR